MVGRRVEDGGPVEIIWERAACVGILQTGVSTSIIRVARHCLLDLGYKNALVCTIHGTYKMALL